MVLSLVLTTRFEVLWTSNFLINYHSLFRVNLGVFGVVRCGLLIVYSVLFRAPCEAGVYLNGSLHECLILNSKRLLLYPNVN
jgi:hypothetical protein